MISDKFKGLILDAVNNLKRNITITISSVISISLVLLIIGIFIEYIYLVDSNIKIISSCSGGMTLILKYVKIIVSFTLLPISLFLIFNQIKMAVYTRRNEIFIMKSVGATDWFIKWPYVIQGIIIGTLGAFIADLSLFCIYSFVYNKLNEFGIGLVIYRPILVSIKIILPFLIIAIPLTTLSFIIALKKIMKRSIYEI